jgi:hypothetical protein
LANQKMGFEGQLFYGAPGSTASTLIENCQDITVTRDVERGNTTVRGDSSVAPIETEHVTLRKLQIEFVMLNDSTDTTLESLRVAVATGAGVALRGKDYSSGAGPDADFTLSQSDPWPLNGAQVITFTATPTRAYGRTPEIYV